MATANGFIMAIDPTDRRKDSGLAPGLVAKIAERCGRVPQRLLADTTAMTRKDIAKLRSTIRSDGLPPTATAASGCQGRDAPHAALLQALALDRYWADTLRRRLCRGGGDGNGDAATA